MSWKLFATEAPEIAEFGKARFLNGAAYLGTIRADGSPRVHPVTPIISDERLFVFMEPTSPKGKDIQRDGRYTLHCGVEDTGGGEGEFYVRGVGHLTTDPALRQEAIAASRYNPKDRYVLFVLDVNFAFMNIYGDAPNVQRWQQKS